jgi:hypothetical protein
MDIAIEGICAAQSREKWHMHMTMINATLESIIIDIPLTCCQKPWKNVIYT